MVRRGGGGFTVLIHRTPLVKVPVKFPALAVAVVAKESVKTLANHIEHELQNGLWQHCAVCEDELQRLWPLEAPYREARIANFAVKVWVPFEVLSKGIMRDLRQRNRGDRKGFIAAQTKELMATIRSSLIRRTECDQQRIRIPEAS